MTYEQVKYLKPSEFKRLCGVKPETFKRMVEVVNHAAQQHKPGIGRPSKLSTQDKRADQLGVFARGSHLLSYRSVMGSQRIDSLSNYPQSRKLSHKFRWIQSAREEKTAAS